MRPMVLLFVALFNSILGLSILFPILAPLGRELSLSEIEIGSLSVAYAAMQLLMAPVWGRLSDRWGRRPVLLIGITGFALSFATFAGIARLGLSHAIEHDVLLAGLVAARLLGGLLSSATLPTGQAYAADITDRGNRTAAMGVIGAAFGLGIVFGPGIGAGIATLADDLLAPVWCSAGVAVLNAIFVAIALPEPARHATAAPSRGTLALGGRLWPVLAIGLVATISSVAMEQTVAFTFQDRLHLDGPATARAVGLALLAYGVVAVLAQGFLVRRFRLRPRTLLFFGLPIALAGFLLFLPARDPAMLTLALCLQGLGQGLVLPGVTAATSLAVTDAEQGAVAGLNGGSQGLGRTLGPVVGPVLYQEVSPEAPYVLAAALLAAVLLVVLVRPRLAREEEAHGL